MTTFNSLGDLFRYIKTQTDEPFDVIENAYWWLVENHAGQWSWEYEAMCRLGQVYTPGWSTNRPSNPVDGLFQSEE